MTGHLASADIGSPAPDFALDAADGRQVTTADLRGRPAVLAFSPQAWDPARPHHVAHVNALVARAPGVEGGIPVFADLDASGSVAELFGVCGEQAIIVLDGRGIIRWRHVGAIKPTGTSDLVDVLVAIGPDPESPVSLLSKPGARGNAGLPDAAGLSDADDARAADTPARSLNLTATRREFVATTLAAAILAAVTPALAKAESAAARVVSKEPAPAAPMPVTLNVNGHDVVLTIEPRVTLLDALREYAGLTGTKKGCDHGQCGACTVHIDGRRELSCLTFAAMHQGAKITTVEGLSTGIRLHAMQEAFIKHDGFQCGYCTPGQLMSATALLAEPCGAADADVRECMSGNICRCGAYPGIIAAIQEVRSTARG